MSKGRLNLSADARQHISDRIPEAGHRPAGD